MYGRREQAQKPVRLALGRADAGLVAATRLFPKMAPEVCLQRSPRLMVS